MTQAYTHNFSEVHQLGDYLQPASRAIGTYNTAWISVQNHQRGVFLLLTGAVGAGSTIDFALQQATDIAGTGAKAFTPAKAITQLTQAGGDENDAVLVEFRTEEMDVDNQFDFVRGVLTIAGGGDCFTALVPLMGCSNYPPVAVGLWEEIVT